MTTALLVLARTLHIGSAMMLFALPYFRVVILRPAFAADPVGSHSSFCQKLTKWMWIALILEAVSGGIWFWLVAAQMSDQSPWGMLDPADLGTVLGQTHFGRLWLVRSVMGIALGVALFFVSRRKKPAPPGLPLLTCLALSGGLLISLAWAGHAAAGVHHHVLHLLADALHLLIGSIWPMGLIPLAGFLWRIDRRKQILPADQDIRVLRKFSRISLIAVLILLATGLINGWLMVGSWEALVTTTYGRLLLGKALVAGIMISLGAVNRLCLMPRIGDAPVMFRALRRTVVAESCLALVVLLIVGVLGMTSPPT